MAGSVGRALVVAILLLAAAVGVPPAAAQDLFSPIAISRDLSTVLSLDRTAGLVRFEPRIGGGTPVELALPAELADAAAEFGLFVSMSVDGDVAVVHSINTSAAALLRDMGTVRDLTGLELRCPDGTFTASTDLPHREVLSHDGLLLVDGLCTDSWSSAILDLRTGEQSPVVPTEPTPHAISGDGRWVIAERTITDLHDGTVRSWQGPEDAFDGQLNATGTHVVQLTLGTASHPRGLYTTEIATGEITRLAHLDDGRDLGVVRDVSVDGMTVLLMRDDLSPPQFFLASPRGAFQLELEDEVYSVTCDLTCSRVVTVDAEGRIDLVAIGGGVSAVDRPLSDTVNLPPPGDVQAAARLALDLAQIEVGPARQVVLASAAGFADALASGVLQADGPVLLVPPGDALPPALMDEIERRSPSEVVVLGGTAAVSPGVEAEVVAAGVAVRRLAGATRVETALQIAQSLPEHPTEVIIARAFGTAESPTQGWADAVAAGALAAERGAPVLLTPSDRLDPTVAHWLASLDVGRATIVGGAAAVSEAVAADLGVLVGEVVRAAGADRFATAAAIADLRDIAQDGPVVLTAGVGEYGWVGGIVSAGSAARRGAPILLSGDADVPRASASVMQRDIGVVHAPGEIVVTCITAESVCDQGRGLLGLPPRVDITVDPPVGTTVQAGQDVRVAVVPRPADAEIRVSGTCVAAPTVLGPDGVAQIDPALRGPSCQLLVTVAHAIGTRQYSTAQYTTDPDVEFIPTPAGCELVPDLSEDGRWVVWGAAFGCPGHVGPSAQNLVVRDLQTGHQLAVDIPGSSVRAPLVPRVGPDGAHVLLADGTRVVDVATGALWSLADVVEDGDRAVRAGSFLDGEHLLVNAQRYEGPDEMFGVYVVVDLRRRQADERILVPAEMVLTPGTDIERPFAARDLSRIISGDGVFDVDRGVLQPWPEAEREVVTIDLMGTTIVYALPDPDALNGRSLHIHQDESDRDLGLDAYSPSLSADGAWLANGDTSRVLNLRTGEVLQGPGFVLGFDAGGRRALVGVDGGIAVVDGPACGCGTWSRAEG